MRGMWLGMAALLPLAGMAGEAVLSMDGVLRLDSPAVELNGCLFTAGWKSVSGSGRTFPDSKGVCAFTLKASDEEQVACKVEVTPAAEGAVRVAYTLTPKSDILLNGFYVNTHFAAQKLIGGRWKADGKEGVFSEKRGALSVFGGKVRQLEIREAAPASGPIRSASGSAAAARKPTPTACPAAWHSRSRRRNRSRSCMTTVRSRCRPTRSG
ncbi:MAG: hypothetical protein BWY59_01586 [Verrucomicrobia bacterium ADurb.Bin345]|nr:MAG: hypothetical protein BWY59_01586 [Verrucomicrobia bacterium ADurb.Bin345]